MSESKDKSTGLASVTLAAAGQSVDSRKAITTTVESVLNTRDAVTRLTKQAVDLSTAQKLMGVKEVLDRVGLAFGEKRDALAAEKGSPSGPNKWKLEPKQMEDFQKEISKVLKEEIQIPLNVCLSVADLCEVRLSAEDLGHLSFLILDLK